MVAIITYHSLDGTRSSTVHSDGNKWYSVHYQTGKKKNVVPANDGGEAHKLSRQHIGELKEEAAINSTGPAVAGTNGDAFGRASKLMKILRRKNPNRSKK